MRGPRAQKEAASPPLTFRRAAQATGPLLRPQGCFASRCARQPCGLPLTPETSAAPEAGRAGQAGPAPPCARRADLPVAEVHDDLVEPNLARIPADGDPRAEAILRQIQDMISQEFLDSLDDSDYSALGRYGARQPTVALRERSTRRLQDALLATALAQLGQQSDTRDVMIGLAVHHIVAQQIGADPSVVFEKTAGRLPDGPMPGLLRSFGARPDITPEAFGWQLVQTPNGPDFMPD
jgi:hypothetical protein